MESPGTERRIGTGLFAPFLLTALIIAVDQATKALIVNSLGLHRVGVSLLDGFLRIVHTRNTGIAFSIGMGYPDAVRRVLFTAVPVLVMAGVVLYYVRAAGLSPGTRWALAGVLGGGTGNIIDRIVRPLGVVDFVDVKFYGILGLERWPTFNVADMSVVICGITFAILTLRKDKEGT